MTERPEQPIDDRSLVTSARHRGALGTIAIMAVALAGALVVGALARSADDAARSDEPVAPNGTEPIASTNRLSGDAEPGGVDTGGPIAGLALGVDQMLAIVDRSGDSIVVDLSDGSTDYLADHSVLAITESFVIAQPLGGSGEVTASGAIVVIGLETGESAPFSGYGETYQIVPAATPDDVWVWGNSGGNFGLFYALVSLDGVGAGVIFSTPAPSRLIERPGREPSFNVEAAGAFAAAPYEPNFLGPGALLASSIHGDVWFVCDDGANCGVEYRSGASFVMLDVELDLTSTNGGLHLLPSGQLAVAYDALRKDVVVVDLETGDATSIDSGDWATLAEMVMVGNLILASRQGETLIIDPADLSTTQIELPTAAYPSFVVGPQPISRR